MTGKPKVAPLKQMTIPRMELTLAIVAVTKMTTKEVMKEVQMELEESTYCTDSTAVLEYIENSTHRFKTFVAN